MNQIRIVAAMLSLLLPAAVAFGQEGCTADADGDGVVNGSDLAMVLGIWGPCAGCAADLNANGQVNGEDLAVVLTRWGSTCAPAVTSMSATAGPLAGGTAVTITGTHLLNPTSVTFGGTPAAVALSSKDSLTVVAPSRSEGPATVIVSTAGGSISAGVFTYYGAPTITTVTPNTGAAAGGSAVTITGTAFFGNPQVTFGSAAASSVSVLSPTQIRAVAPSGAVGSTVAISVATPSGATSLPSAFSYVPIIVPSWATLLEALPDPSIVTSESLRNAIAATGYAWRVRDIATQIEMLLIPSGTFNMGCSASSLHGCSSHELPVHSVHLSHAFYIGRYEVTQAQWVNLMGSNPSVFQGPAYPDHLSQPVEMISPNLLEVFLATTGVRVPTEAEWEYAYRAGTTTAFHAMPGLPNGTDDDSRVADIAWWSGNSGGHPRPVGLKAGNGLGLHDMAGNVSEFVSDFYSESYYAVSPTMDPTGPVMGSYRVGRGGTALSGLTSDLRASSRGYASLAVAVGTSGFRVARSP
jgi:formylglycine-generating enzyme required for sulfatase activity